MTKDVKTRIILEFSFPHVFTWGDRDRDKRERIRRAASKSFGKPLEYSWYSFNIKIERSKHKRPLDVENVSKLIIDAFSGEILKRDDSEYRNLELYPDDDLRYVRKYRVEGVLVNSAQDSTAVQIVGHK